MLEPVAVLETFFGVVAGRVAVIGFDEGLHFLVFLKPQLVLRHTAQTQTETNTTSGYPPLPTAPTYRPYTPIPQSPIPRPECYATDRREC